MTHPAPAPPYPRSGPEGVRPQPLGVTRLRLGAVVAAWVAGVALVLVACGLGTPYRLGAVADRPAVPVVLVTVLALVGPLRRARTWLRVVLASGAVAAALLLTLAALVVRPAPLGAASYGDLRVTATTPGLDTLTVRVERTGWLFRDLDAACTHGLSVAPDSARVTWTGASTFMVDVRGSDASGRWRFEVVDDTLVPVGRSAMRAC